MPLVSTICGSMCRATACLQLKMAANRGKSPRKSRGQSWKDQDVKELIQIMQEETIIFSLDNAKSPKEKRAAYKSVQVQLQNRGKLKLCEMFSTSIELEISDFLEVVLQNTTCIALETIVFTFWLFYLFTYCFFILL